MGHVLMARRTEKILNREGCSWNSSVAVTLLKENFVVGPNASQAGSGEILNFDPCRPVTYVLLGVSKISRKSVKKIQIPLKSDKNNGHFKWRPIYIFITSRSNLLRMRNVSDEVVNKTKIHILCSITFFPENHAAYEIMWRNTVESYRSHMTI